MVSHVRLAVSGSPLFIEKDRCYAGIVVQRPHESAATRARPFNGFPMNELRQQPSRLRLVVPTALFLSIKARASSALAALCLGLVLGSGTVSMNALAADSSVKAPVDIPANGFATNSSYGKGWSCKRGYVAKGGTCSEVQVPTNGFLDATGTGWKCSRGYRDGSAECVAIKVPEHGYLNNTRFGSGWDCRRGYRATAEECVAIAVPENGYLTDASTRGLGWACEWGFRPVGAACVLLSVPEHGHLNGSSFGTGWECNRGFRETGERCAEIVLPAHAHLDYSGNNWRCDESFRKTGKTCVGR